jgi:hypothetical protein
MGIEWEGRNLIYDSLKHTSDFSTKPEKYRSEVTKHIEGQTSIQHPGSNINDSATTVSSHPSPQGNARNYSISSVIPLLASERTSIGNVQVPSQIKQVNFELERLRLEERRLEFDMDLGERQYKLDMQRLEIERLREDKVNAGLGVRMDRMENLIARVDRIETKLLEIIQLLRIPIAQ